MRKHWSMGCRPWLSAFAASRLKIPTCVRVNEPAESPPIFLMQTLEDDEAARIGRWVTGGSGCSLQNQTGQKDTHGWRLANWEASIFLSVATTRVATCHRLCFRPLLLPEIQHRSQQSKNIQASDHHRPRIPRVFRPRCLLNRRMGLGEVCLDFAFGLSRRSRPISQQGW